MSGFEITLDDGRALIVGQKIAEGGCSSVSMAWDAGRQSGKEERLYALKRINCGDRDAADERFRKEVRVHRTFVHENLMPLLGMKFETSPPVCYMAFPYVPISLRSDIASRQLLDDVPESQRRPYPEQEALALIYGVAGAIRAMHNAGISHRDVTVENVLLKKDEEGRLIPVLTDFGSAGPLITPLQSRSDTLRAMEEAASDTTFSYCAPELIGGGGAMRHSPSEVLDYGKADVWGLGCVLFAILYGSSPFEVEWGISLSRFADAAARIVECTRNKILTGHIPFPPGGTSADERYGDSIKNLVRWMLNRIEAERPSSSEVVERVRCSLLVESNNRGPKKVGKDIKDESDQAGSIPSQ